MEDSTAVDLDHVALKPVLELPSDPTSPNLYCTLFRPEIVPETMKFLIQRPDGSYAQQSFPLSITVEGKVMDKKGRSVLDEKPIVTIPFYPSLKKLNDQIIQTFVADLLLVFKEWVPEEDYHHTMEHTGSIAIPCFQHPRCPLAPLYTDTIIAKMVTDLVTYHYQPTSLLNKIIKNETMCEEIIENKEAVANYLKETTFFYPAMRFAHKHQYG